MHRGNYSGYYGYRKDDRRIELLRRSWLSLFKGKKILDVGCNTGQVTVQMSELLAPSFLVGVDVDHALIRRARVNTNAGFRCNDLMDNTDACFRCDDFMDNTSVRFRCDDFMDERCLFSPQDVIFCLSVSKWIHFEHGDEGIRALFAKVHQLLRPRGIFVFEPQPWSSYLRHRSRVPKKDMRLRPEAFPALLQDVLFDSVACIENASSFNRPLYIYRRR